MERVQIDGGDRVSRAERRHNAYKAKLARRDWLRKMGRGTKNRKNSKR